MALIILACHPLEVTPRSGDLEPVPCCLWHPLYIYSHLIIQTPYRIRSAKYEVLPNAMPSPKGNLLTKSTYVRFSGLAHDPGDWLTAILCFSWDLFARSLVVTNLRRMSQSVDPYYTVHSIFRDLITNKSTNRKKWLQFFSQCVCECMCGLSIILSVTCLSLKRVPALDS